MPYAFVQDVASTWARYEEVTAAVMDPVPAGLLLHIAGPTEEGVRVIDVWENEQAWDAFRNERLVPAIAALGGPARPEPTFRELHATQIVLPDRERGGPNATPSVKRQRSSRT